MSVPPEVTAAFDAALPGHSGVEDWYGIRYPGHQYRALCHELEVYARPGLVGWEVTAHTPHPFRGQTVGTDADLATAIRAAVAGAAKLASRYAAKQARAAARRMARAAEVEALAAKWGAV